VLTSRRWRGKVGGKIRGIFMITHKENPVVKKIGLLKDIYY